MKKYLVGGAVRDSLLNLPITEKDWVITGSTPQEMLNIGYEQVGKDFPVFLHPKNHEEYALARTERKSGPGYTGFICNSHPSITIEEDLYRRDLTINAMAYDMNGKLLDPYHGQRDIKLRLLRHVSHAFNEDPLRILRVARFAAKFKNIGFTIAVETLKLMTTMIHELKSLSPERIWIETKKALMTDSPQTYFKILRKCGALKILFPELDILFAISGFKKQHLHFPNLGEYTMMKLSNISNLNKNLALRYSILYCNLINKINLPSIQLNTDYIYQQLTTFMKNDLCKKLKIPNVISKLSKITTIYYNDLYDVTKLSPKTMMSIFQSFNCWKFHKNIEQIIHINQSHLIEEKYHINYLYSQEKFLRTALSITIQIKTHDIINDGFNGSHISKEMYSRRIHVLTMWMNQYKLTKKHIKPYYI